MSNLPTQIGSGPSEIAARAHFRCSGASRGRYRPSKMRSRPSDGCSGPCKKSYVPSAGWYVPSKRVTYPPKEVRTLQKSYVPSKRGTYPPKEVRTFQKSYAPTSSGSSARHDLILRLPPCRPPALRINGGNASRTDTPPTLRRGWRGRWRCRGGRGRSSRRRRSSRR